LKVLITGGLGFIGTNLTAELRRRGYETWACDLTHSDRDYYRRCDIREYRQLDKLLSEQAFDFVYHAAAEYGRWNGEDYYENLWMTNAIGTKHIVRLQEKLRFKMVLFSSAEVYGDYTGTMAESVMDTTPLKQMNDYAMTKWVNEMQVLNSAAMFGTETVRIRLFNVYGPHEHYTPFRGVVPTFIYKALHDQPYTVYRGHKRTFEYVNDVCVTLANISERFKPGEVYNIASEKQYEIKYLSDLILTKLAKDDSSVSYKNAEPFTTKLKRGDFSRARQDLEHACPTSLEEGITRTIRWMRTAYKIPEEVRQVAVR